jgi:hypothetical protein
MLFSDLMSFPYDRGSGTIDLVALQSALPNTPESVCRQFYADHGRKQVFQDLYANVRLDRIIWSSVSLTASDLVTASMNPDFRRWFDSVSHRAEDVLTDGWRSVDLRRDVVRHWELYGTWVTPPVMIDASVIGLSGSLHLVEGHTRVGLLSGLLRQGVISGESAHLVWLGAAVEIKRDTPNAVRLRNIDLSQ